MARSTFEGPILSGDNRLPPFRNVGYTDLAQSVVLDFTNTTNGTANYSGSSGQYVTSSIIPNQNVTVYQPSATVYPPVAQTVTVDTATVLYRGAVFYVPYLSKINDILVDVQALQTLTTGTVTGMEVLVHNNFLASGGTARYLTLGTSGTTFTAGRQNLTSQYSATQLNNMLATTGDITDPPGFAAGGGQGTSPYSNLVSQVVVNVATTVAGANGAVPFTAGRYIITLRYTQIDPAIGNTTTYPYGNFT